MLQSWGDSSHSPWFPFLCILTDIPSWLHLPLPFSLHCWKKFHQLFRYLKLFKTYHLHSLKRDTSLSLFLLFSIPLLPQALPWGPVSQIYFIYFWRRTRGRWCLQKLKEERRTYLAHAKKTNMKSLEPPDPLECWSTCHFLRLDALIFMSSKNKVLDVTQQLPQEIIHSFHCCRLQGKKKKAVKRGEKKPVPLQNIQFPSSSSSLKEKNVLVWCPSNSCGFVEDFGECIYSFANCKNRFILQPCAEWLYRPTGSLKA